MSLLFLNGKIASLDENDSFYEAIGMNGETIDFLGNKKEAMSIRNKYEKVINLGGRTMIPSFNDSHMHLLNYGYSQKKLKLSKFKSINEIIEKSIEFINKNNIPEGKFILGRGWNQDYLYEKRYLTIRDLDNISKEHPIIFTRTCGHVAVCNSKALSMINKELLEKRKVNIDIKNGIFVESALEILYKIVDSPNLDEIKNMISQTCDELIKNGITSVQTDDLDTMPDRDFEKVITAYEELERKDLLKVRVYEQCLLPKKEQLEDFIYKGYKTGKGNNFFRIGPLKLLLDGSLGGRTALLNKPYHDDPQNTGIMVYSQKELDDYICFAHNQGMQIAVHAIGDKAMEMVLGAFEKIENNSPNNEMRHGIVHCQLTNKEIINRFAKNNIIAYIQPIFLDYDLHIVQERIGSRYLEAYGFNTMNKMKVKICGGSDAPVVHFNPFENIYCSVTRKDLKGYPKVGFMPEEKLSLNDALKLFTINSAYSSFEENIKGSLEKGKLADMIVLDRDIFTINENEIKNVKVYITVVNGRIVYQRFH